MIQRIVGWVTGCLGFIASVIAISAALGNAPLKVVGDIEFHATAWVLLATVFFGVCCGLTVPPLVNRCWTAPRRARAARFQELLLEIKALRSYYDQHDSGRGAGGRDAYATQLAAALAGPRRGRIVSPSGYRRAIRHGGPRQAPHRGGGGGGRGMHARLQEQTRRLFDSTIQVVYRGQGDEPDRKIAGVVADSQVLWSRYELRRRQGGGVATSVVRGERFFQEVIHRPVPIDLNVLRALLRRPLSLTWAATGSSASPASVPRRRRASGPSPTGYPARGRESRGRLSAGCSRPTNVDDPTAGLITGMLVTGQR